MVKVNAKFEKCFTKSATSGGIGLDMRYALKKPRISPE
jgi:hypothetical protein